MVSKGAGAIAKPLDQGLGQVVKPVSKGLDQIFIRVGNGIGHAIDQTGDFAQRHRNEIIVVALIAAGGYLACADGCTVILGIGEKTFVVGSIGGPGGITLATGSETAAVTLGSYGG